MCLIPFIIPFIVLFILIVFIVLVPFSKCALLFLSICFYCLIGFLYISVPQSLAIAAY